MKKQLFLILSFLFIACGLPAPQLPPISTAPEVKVFRDTYIVTAHGDWCPWEEGMSSCPQVFGAGDYSVRKLGTHLLKIQRVGIQSDEVVTYDPDNDLCKTDPQLKDLSCSPDFVAEGYLDTNDPLRMELWGLDNIKAPQGWEKIKETDLKVAIVDTGIDDEHEDLKNFIEGQFNAYDDSGWARDGHGHGTHVTGTICAVGNNQRGVVGVAWKCRILSAKVLTNTGAGSYSAIIAGIDWAVENGAKVINASLGGGGYSRPLYDAIQRAGVNGIVFVAAAGNHGINTDQTPSYPASYDLDNIISVAALDQNDGLANFSNYGVKTVHIAAPGVAIKSTFPGNDYRNWQGTSMATPHVAGAAALILGREPELTPRQVRNKILGGARKLASLNGLVASGGTLDLNGAIDAFRGSPGAPIPEPDNCDETRFKRCRKNCGEKYNCAYVKQKRCRESCRKSWCPESEPDFD